MTERENMSSTSSKFSLFKEISCMTIYLNSIAFKKMIITRDYVP